MEIHFTINGHQWNGTRVAPWQMFRNKELVTLLALNAVLNITLGFNYSFFPLYYKQVGGGSVLLGVAMFLTGISEIPFLLFAEKILNRLGIRKTLLLSNTAAGIRWLLLYLVADRYAVLAVSLMHGLTFIIFSYSLATYINREVPRELRASGQTTAALVSGFARVIGSMGGGVLCEMAGVRQGYFYSFLINFAALAAFGAFFYLTAQNKKDGAISKVD